MLQIFGIGGLRSCREVEKTLLSSGLRRVLYFSQQGKRTINNIRSHVGYTQNALDLKLVHLRSGAGRADCLSFSVTIPMAVRVGPSRVILRLLGSLCNIILWGPRTIIVSRPAYLPPLRNIIVHNIIT